MGVRDTDIDKLIAYAKLLGISVKFVKPTRNDGEGDWDGESKTIRVFTRSKLSKTSIILTLLHELGHQLDWIYRGHGTEDKELDEALTQLNRGRMVGARPDLTRRQRYLIYREEREAIKYMILVHKELNIKLPEWKVLVQQELDLFDYYTLLTKGRFSTSAEYFKYKDKLLKQYRK